MAMDMVAMSMPAVAMHMAMMMAMSMAIAMGMASMAIAFAIAYCHCLCHIVLSWTAHAKPQCNVLRPTSMQRVATNCASLAQGAHFM